MVPDVCIVIGFPTGFDVINDFIRLFFTPSSSLRKYIFQIYIQEC